MGKGKKITVTIGSGIVMELLLTAIMLELLGVSVIELIRNWAIIVLEAIFIKLFVSVFLSTVTTIGGIRYAYSKGFFDWLEDQNEV